MPKHSAFKRSRMKTIRIFALALVLLLVFSQIGWFETASQQVIAGEFPIDGYIAQTATVRSGPGTSHSSLGTLPGFHRVTVTGQVTGQKVTISTGTSDVWYKINYKDASGKTIDAYMFSLLVVLYPTDIDSDFEKKLDAEKFPTSYRPMLRALHAEYPDWSFKAMHVDMSWEDAVNGQARRGVSLIENGVNDNWKSTESAAYDWAKDEWIIYDSDRWVMASKGVIGYYMDPRNMLGPATIFQFEDLNYCDQAHTKAGVENILKGTFMDGKSIERHDKDGNKAGTVSYADAFMEAAAESGVSPYHLASRVVQEVGTGGSASVSGTYKDYKGYYNYFNIGAHSSTDPVARGLEYAMYGPKRKPVDSSFSQSDKDFIKLIRIPWDNHYDSIVGGANFLGNNYIGRQQHTLYLQRFNLHASSYPSHQYMTNIRAVASEAIRFASGYSKQGSLENSMEFLIPVYKNMPDKAVPLPPQSGNPNNWLRTLRVDGKNVSPSFRPDTRKDYSFIVDHHVRSVELTATPVNSKARVNSEKAGTYRKKHDLKVGDNIIKLEVRAENGSRRTYEVNVYRRLADPTKLNSEVYVVTDSQITGLDLSKDLNKVENLKKHLNVPEDHKMQIVDKDGKEAKDTVGTGYRVELVLANQVVSKHTILVYGDVTGNGRIGSSDLNSILNHVLGRKELKGIQAVAADVDRNDRVGSSDLNHVLNHVLARNTIKQD